MRGQRVQKKRRPGALPLLLLLVAVIAGGIFLLWRQNQAHAQETALYEKQISALTAQIRQGEHPIDVYFEALLQNTDLELDPYAYTTAGMSAQGWAAAQAWKQELEYALEQLDSGPDAQDQEVKDRFLALVEEEDQLLHQLLVMDTLPDTPPEQRNEEIWLGSMYSHVSQWRLAGLYANAWEQLNSAISLYDEAPLESRFDESVLEQLRSQLFPDDRELSLGILPPIADVVN